MLGGGNVENNKMIRNKRQIKSRARRRPPLKRNRRKAYCNIKRFIPLTLVIVGCLFISVAYIMRFYSSYRQKQLVHEYESSLEDSININDLKQQEVSEQVIGDVAQTTDDKLLEQNQTIDVSEGSNIDDSIQTLGVLKIPKIDLTVAIGEGTDNKTLKYAVGHFNNTALPGDVGNSCIAGHRNYTWGKFFNRLDEVAVGDDIIVERNKNTYSYTVTDTFVVEPEDTWVLDQSEDAEITLITCTPMYSSAHRLIVKGTLNSQ